MSEQSSNQPQVNQAGQIVLGNQTNIVGNVVLDPRAVYADLTAQVLLAACQSQVQGVLNNVRQKYDATLYVHRAIETELTTFFDQPLADPNRNCYLIVAPAGSGKTNLLCDLAQERVKQQPVVLILGHSAELSGERLLNTLKRELEAASTDVRFYSAIDSRDILDRLANVLNRDALIFIDAINEHAQSATMRNALEELLQRTRNKRIKLVITCRDFYWNLFKGSFWDEAIVNVLQVAGVDDGQEINREDTQSSFYRFKEKEQAEALELYLLRYNVHGQPVGAALEQCRHPLLLRFFCEAYKGQEIGEIEDIRLKELFDRYWARKLESIAEHSIRQGIELTQEGLTAEAATYLLNVAGYMLYHNERAILLAKLPEATQVTENTSDPRSIYGRIRNEFIILEQQELGKNKRKILQVAFVYEEFMEYVMARALIQTWDDQELDDTAILTELKKLKQSYRNFVQILGVMVYLAIMLKETRNLAFWSLLINSGEAWRNVVFEAFKKLPANQLDAGVYDTLLDMLNQDDQSVKTQVLDLLKLQRISLYLTTYEALFAAVCDLAVHGNPKLARRATLALQYSANARLIPLCLQNLRHRRLTVRNNAVTLLTSIGKEAVEPLIAALQDEKYPVRQGATHALGLLGDTRAVEPLIVALEDEDDQVREEATHALGLLGDTRAVEPLIAALQDKVATVRRGATHALGLLRDTRAVEPLIAALQDEDARVRQEVTHILRQLEGNRAVEPLIAAMQNENDWMCREVTDALGLFGEMAVEPLITALQDENNQVRRRALHVLGQLKDARAVEPLIAALQDKDYWVRWEATHALGLLGDTRAVEPLIAALQDEKYPVRQGATHALGLLGDTRAVEPLIVALEDEDDQVREEATHALGLLGDTRAVEPLIAALQDKVATVRRGATHALGLLRDTRAVEPLIAALQNEDYWVRQDATHALGLLGDTRVVELLIATLQDKDYWVREEATHALGLLGDTRAVEPLIAALQDKIATVRRGATHALGLLRDTRAVEPLIAALQDKDYWVRQDATHALGLLGDIRAIEPLVMIHAHKLVTDELLAQTLAQFQRQDLQILEFRLNDFNPAIRQRVKKLLSLIKQARAKAAKPPRI